MLCENRFLETSRGHNIRPNRALYAQLRQGIRMVDDNFVGYLQEQCKFDYEHLQVVIKRGYKKLKDSSYSFFKSFKRNSHPQHRYPHIFLLTEH